MEKQSIELKISGVRDPENIAALCLIPPKYLSFDFRATSDRYMGEIDEALLCKIPHTIRKIGVFAQSSPLYISYITGRFGLNGAQIEGDTTITTCEILAAEGLEIIKVIDSLSQIEKYEGVCNKFLIRDAKIAERYNCKTPLIVDAKIYNENLKNVSVVDTSDDFEQRIAYKNCAEIENWYSNIIR